MTTKISLIKANQIKTQLNNMLGKKVSITLSLAYYSMIQGNSAPLKGFSKDIGQDLDRNTRQFICNKFDSKANDWVYNKSKSEKLCKELSLTFQKSTFEEFCAAINTKLEVKVEVAPVDFDKRGRTQIKNAVKSLRDELGLSDATIKTILADVLAEKVVSAT